MIKRSIMLITAAVIIIAFGCASGGPKPGTGGTTSAKTIEKAGHPSIPEGVKCYVCHKRDVPEHEFHRKFGIDCAQCHVKSIWMASKYPHDEWPLDKNHQTRCTFCHRDLSNFNFTYQCWGCHHKDQETIKNHADLGIDDITECAKCHTDLTKKLKKVDISF